MMLHSASRLGVLSYLYQQRHDIAYAVGLIAEIPIAMCNSDYDFGSGLVIVSANGSDHSLPPQSLQAREIQLFVNEFIGFIEPRRLEFKIDQPFLVESAYSSPPLSIFHPPS